MASPRRLSKSLVFFRIVGIGMLARFPTVPPLGWKGDELTSPEEELDAVGSIDVEDPNPAGEDVL
jgi:hypothetical protein